MIAVAGWLVWRTAGSIGAALIPLSIYFVHLVLNGAWSGFVFGLQRLGLGLADVAALWLSILALVFMFYPISPIAAWLLMPYLIWVTFAAALNFAVWRLNRGRPD